jgi:hypothetical protein
MEHVYENEQQQPNGQAPVNNTLGIAATRRQTPRRGNRPALQLEPNKPVLVAMKYPQGLACANGQRVMYSLTDGRVMFVDLATAAKITALDINVDELFWICQKVQKSKPIEYDVWLDPASEKARAVTEVPSIEAELRRSITSVNQKRYAPQLPAQTALVRTAATPKPAVHQGWSQFLISQTDALTDAYAAALSYARQHHGETVKPEDVRTFIVTAFINQTKNGGGPHVV